MNFLFAILFSGAREIPEAGHAKGPRSISGQWWGKAPTVKMGSAHVKDD